MISSQTARRIGTYGAVTAASAAVGTATVWLAAATYVARLALTPDPKRPDDVEIRVIHTDSLTLDLTRETVVPGRYGLWLDGGRGHARVGEVFEIDHSLGRVRRRLIGVDRGVLRPGPARWNQYYYGESPDLSLGLTTQYLDVPTDLGPMPAWLIPAEEPTSRWAILVHGRGALRHECLRAVLPLRRQGLTCLIPSYRNDEGAPAGPDGRYNLGLAEWRDVEDAIRLAVEHGAREIVLAGWSMGGAIVLQALSQSECAPLVSRAILDGPVVDWADVLRHHAELNSVPRPVANLSRVLMGRRWARRLVGVRESVDVARTNWVKRADELTHPLLLIHSRDDEFVPSGPSEALARARPDLVSYAPWSLARHCKEWNVDPERWERLVEEFVAQP